MAPFDPNWSRFARFAVALVLIVAACVRSEGEATPTQGVRPANGDLALHTVVHPRQELEPTLTWREGRSGAVPLALTASDGTGLDLVTMDARVVVEDPLAFTELKLVFKNPENRRREGRFEFDLPPGAKLSRLAMKISGRFQEGEVLARGRGQRVYETFVHERPNVDPALLEHDAGNRIRARVFPILPGERKEIIVSYTQALGRAPYRLPLRGLSQIDRFDARVVVKTHDSGSATAGAEHSTQRVVELQRERFTPKRDMVVALGGAQAAAGVHAGDMSVVRVRPEATRPPTPLERLVVVLDTSASAGAGFTERLARLGELITALRAEGEFDLRVVCFDQRVETVFDGPATMFGEEMLADIAARRAFGASDLAAAMAAVANGDETWPRMLLVSDGIATAGAVSRSELRTAAQRLRTAGVERIDVLAPPGRRDETVVAELAAALEQPGTVVDEDETPEAITHAMLHAPFGDVGITVAGASWSWPKDLTGVRPGEDVRVYAGFDGPAPASTRVIFTDTALATHEIQTLPVEAPLVARAVAGARIERLERSMATAADPGGVRDSIVALSTKHRLLTDYTALLVLESEADYRRFGIRRDALADILTVDSGAVRLLNRSGGHTPQAGPLVASRPDPDDDPDMLARNRGILGLIEQGAGHFLASPYGGGFAVGNDDEDVWGGTTGDQVGDAFGIGGLGLGGSRGGGDLGLMGQGRGGGGIGEGTIGLGNIGLIGKGSGGGSGTGAGYGRGTGAGFGGRGKRVPRVRIANPQITAPQVRPGKAKIMGGLDKDVVRRIIRRHVNEVRHCYSQGLMRDPRLEGRVEVQFAIGATGTVAASTLTDVRIKDRTVANCVARTVKRWKFPKPMSGGTVIVTYPFLFSTDGSVSNNQQARPRLARRARRRPRRPAKATRQALPAHTGQYAQFRRLLDTGATAAAYEVAREWTLGAPTDPLGLVAFGEALERKGRVRLAARVYGSIIDLFPSRADYRRVAGQRLERLGPEGLTLAADTFAKAAQARADQPSGARQRAWALAQRGEWQEAFEALRQAYDRRYPSGRFAGLKRVLRQDLALVAAGWIGSVPNADEIRAKVRAAGVKPATEASRTVVMSWETDASDVDLKVRVPGRASRRARRISDVRTGFGPEAVVLRGNRARRGVQVAAHYYDRRAQGFSLGTVQVIDHDGAGGLSVQSRPFVLMQALGQVELGTFDGPLRSPIARSRSST